MAYCVQCEMCKVVLNDDTLTVMIKPLAYYYVFMYLCTKIYRRLFVCYANIMKIISFYKILNCIYICNL